MKLIIDQEDKVSIEVVDRNTGESVSHQDLFQMVQNLHKLKETTIEPFAGEEIEEIDG